MILHKAVIYQENRNYNPFSPLLPPLSTFRQSLLINIKKIDENILKKHDELITKTLLYSDGKFDLSYNRSIISSAIEFIVLLKDLVIH